MCIIAAKPAGIKMPDLETIETMWYENPHGAGLMYTYRQTQKRKGKKVTTNVVKVEKGFMKLPDFLDRLEELGKEIDLTATPVVMHFRITTHGGTCPENCHPFPVTESIGVLKKRVSTASLGVAHNGIIPITPRKGISDTMEYIATQLAPLYAAMPDFLGNKHAVRMVENAIHSKMAFLTPEGSIHTIGKFEEHEGIKYSNSSYMPYTLDPRYSCCYGGGWDTFSFADFGKGGKRLDEPVPTTRMLMYLADVTGAYGRDADGELLDGDDLAMDEKGRVYWYDPEICCWTERPGTSALTAEGLPLRYDYDLATPDETLDAGEAEIMYDILYGGQ